MPQRILTSRALVPDEVVLPGRTPAGLAADGTTSITGVEHVDRGYQGLEERLRSLGAAVYRESVQEVPVPKRKSA